MCFAGAITLFAHLATLPRESLYEDQVGFKGYADLLAPVLMAFRNLKLFLPGICWCSVLDILFFIHSPIHILRGER